MIVGVLTLDLVIHGALTLKDRRRVVASIKDRLRHRFNVSVAEVGALEDCRHATLAVAMVSSDARLIQKTLNHISERVDDMHLAEIRDQDLEFL